jgi:hypothetical protein
MVTCHPALAFQSHNNRVRDDRPSTYTPVSETDHEGGATELFQADCVHQYERQQFAPVHSYAQYRIEYPSAVESR